MTPDTGRIRRIAIVNRGEAAMRFINAVGELRREGRDDLRAIALHTAAERTAMFAREADEAVCIDEGVTITASSPYLDLDALEHALVRAEADAVWVGWGFVAERAEFAELCERLGIVFIGPRADVMRALGDKIGAKLLAEKADVPVAAWSGGSVDTIDDAREHASRIGYPLMIKATAGGGGRGIRRVDDDAGLAEAFESARAEGANAFGDATVFMESVVTDARHVEVQVIADTHGTAWAVGVRDCSLQRRNQKVIEESHCVALTPEQDRDLRAAAVRLAEEAGYENAGTVEFLYQPDQQRFAFLEVNTRLQVEHPVTELTTGLDIVKLQIHVADGGRLEGDPPPTDGFAIEARLNAEDPQRAFAPAPGRVSTFRLPVGPGVRVDTGVAEGDTIPPEYDSMIAKVIAFGSDRDEAIARLHRSLSQMVVLVEGGTTNKSFLLDLLDRPEVRSGEVTTSWLDELTAASGHLPTRLADVGLLVAAVDAHDLQETRTRDAFFAWAARGRPQLEAETADALELRHGDVTYRLDVERITPERHRVGLDGTTVDIEVTRIGPNRSRVTVGGTRHAVVSSIDGSDHLVEVDGVAHRYTRDDAGTVRAPSAALVVRVDVEQGDLVEAGQRLAVVEAMKMEIAVTAPIAGRVRDVHVTRTTQVVAGAPLFRLEPDGDDDADEAQSRIDLSSIASIDGASAPDPMSLVRASLLGFDVSPAWAHQLVMSGAIDRSSPDVLDLLDVYADLASLQPERQDVDNDERRGPREYFAAFLRSLDAEREGIPEWFCDSLRRAVAHYGVDDIEPSPALRDALVRIFVAHQRFDEHDAIVRSLLDGLLPDDGLREALERLIEASRRRSQPLANLARSVRYERFDRPVIESAHGEVSVRMQEVASRVVSSDQPTADDLDTLVGCPLPLLPILAGRDILADAPSPGALLEVLTRRYYRIRDLAPVTVETTDDHDVVRTRYDRGDRSVHVLAVRAADESADLSSALSAVAAVARTIDEGTVVVDVYLPRRAGSAAVGELHESLDRALSEVALPDDVRRVALMSSRSAERLDVTTFRRTGDDGVQPYWMERVADEDDIRPAAHGFAEDVKFRGLHPMIARRLQMWRLSNFEISRLPAEGEIHLYDCVARTAPNDRRLVAVAEVRDITPVRDDDGTVVALPELEHVLVGCLDAIRDARRTCPGADALEWNRIMLHVWPVADLPLDDLSALSRRLAANTEGLGIEQVVVSGRLVTPGSDEPTEVVLRVGYERGRGVTVRVTDPVSEPMQPVDDYTSKLIRTRRRGLVYPYELTPVLAGTNGTFVEHDLDDGGRLVPVDRPAGENTAGVVVGVVRTPSDRHADGITRVAVLGDPTKSMGSITEAECTRLLAAIDLAAEMDVPIEWFALSAGAKIAMDSGSENLDWVARVLRRLVEHTQAGGEVNIVVAGINVGAQPYWNAESTMLMHTRGILVMTPDSAMVLTGKQAIDYSGGVSADDNLGIGGYERVMGPNGEAQYWAPSLTAACDVLHHHYALTYRPAGERWPMRAETDDPIDRDVRDEPHDVEGVDFTTVGDIFSDDVNPDRKKPFDIRTVMRAVADRDHAPLERWPEMGEAEAAVVWDARLGGHAVSLVGVESRPLQRRGTTPADGPEQWSAGTLFPLSSKKVARAINAASGNRPVVVVANLSGFDGSPESLRRLQLEYGAEIGRAIVNFDGPIVLCVVSRYHGGAFVVFSGTLNDDMEVLAVEGSFASVIGGAPAAAVVFTRDVDERTRDDERVVAARAAVADAAPGEVASLEADAAEVWDTVRTEKLGEVAAEFDDTHSVERARDVGSVDRIVAAERLRPELVAAVERGMQRVDAR